MKSVYHVFGGCGERAGSGGRGAEHHRKGRVTLQHSTERGEINSDKLQIFTNYYRRKRRGKGWWWEGGGGGGHIGANLLTRDIPGLPLGGDIIIM